MFYSKSLKKFKEIKHCFFSRRGGFSSGLYKSLNCGKGSKDKRINISKNLKYVSQKMYVKKRRLILMYQTHSNKVIEINESNLNKNINSDAMITKYKKVALAVLTADCVPILIYDKRNEIIGCIHAGWKGALSGIIEKTISKIKKKNTKSDIFASVGPCISTESYEVDLNFYRKFLAKAKRNKKYFILKKKNKKLFNLRKYVNDKLLELNVKVDHINRDTYREKKNFFSYRRSSKLKQNDYGRCISTISMI
ncbi:peptidoglycan editing factor PgeF [Candidatus Pelagibacter bacterium]|nr:peptidoglycan editing factor PgeF [Candidatus Pelagibacter bacterium]